MRITLLNDSIKEILNSEFSVEAKIELQNPPGIIKYIRVIPHLEYSQESALEIGREAYLFWCDCLTDDILDVKQNDKITIEDEKYNIEVIEHKINNWSTLRMTKV